MSKLIVTQEFWDIFPQVEIAVVLSRGLDNTTGHPEILAGLDAANLEAKKFLKEELFSENKAIAVWRAAYQQFKTKKGVRSSIENLLKRVEKGNPVGTINPLVDLYNTISLDYGIPCGGEDLDTLRGDMLLTKAQGGEPFLALGDEEEDCALAGEVVYKDDMGIVCRCWNWRDGKRTMLTEGTKNAILVIESVDPSRHEDLLSAANRLAALSEKYLGGQSEVKILHAQNREITL
jgi:DNA/RNA-binding domain of Phe-tRNA-synthetase-like protein